MSTSTTTGSTLRPSDELEGCLLPPSTNALEDNIISTAVPVCDVPPKSSTSEAAPTVVAAQILPTYEMASSSPAQRDLIDKVQVATAESLARVKKEQEWQKYQAASAWGASEKRAFDMKIQEANRKATLRDAEGIEIKEDKWLKAAQDLNKSKEQSVVPAPTPQKKVPGYHIHEYDTMDQYRGLEYRSNYEYKSVYD